MRIMTAICIISMVLATIYGLSRIDTSGMNKWSPDNVSNYNIQKCINEGGFPITQHNYVNGYETFMECKN